MFTYHVDLGQLIIAGLIAMVGWFTKRTIDKIENRLDKGEDAMFTMAGNIQRLIGSMVANDKWNSENDRRARP